MRISTVAGRNPGAVWVQNRCTWSSWGREGRWHSWAKPGWSPPWWIQVNHLPNKPLWESFWKWKPKQTTSLLKTLLWLPITQRTKDRPLSEAHKVLHVLTSSPTRSQCIYVSVSSRREAPGRQPMCSLVLHTLGLELDYSIIGTRCLY